MNIGILTPSIYMYNTRFRERIFAPGELARHLVAGLLTRGHRVSWFTAPDEETNATLVAGDRMLLDQDLRIRAFQDLKPEVLDAMSLYGTKMYYEMDLVMRAFASAQKGELDVLHVFHSFGYLAQYFADLTHVRTLFTIHDPKPDRSMLEHWMLGRFTTPRFVSISRAQQIGWEDLFISNVYNGIDLREFPFDAQGGDRLVAVGRMVAEKGFDHAISAVEATNGKLTIASWVNDTVKQSEYYTRDIEPHVDGNAIVIDSLLRGSDRLNLYQKAKALLFPIRWEEPFGLVMVESMACGTPVIAYNRGSVSEIVRDGVTGYIIDPEDTERPGKGSWIIKKQGIEGLIEAIGRIREIDRAACRKHVKEHFSVEKMVEGYERVYQKVIESHNH